MVVKEKRKFFEFCIITRRMKGFSGSAKTKILNKLMEESKFLISKIVGIRTVKFCVSLFLGWTERENKLFLSILYELSIIVFHLILVLKILCWK